MIILSKIYNNLYNFKERLFSNIADIFSFVAVRVYLLVLAFLNLFLWVFSIFFVRGLSQSLIILHYNVDFGADLIGDVKNIFVIPILGLFIIIFNLSLSFVFLKSRHFRFIMHILLATSVLVNIFLLLSLGPIYLINFR